MGNKHQFCWIRNECIIPHFYGTSSYTNKKMCKKAHTYILYFMFVCIVCFIRFFICFAVVSIFAINLYQGNHDSDAIFFCFCSSTEANIYCHNARKYQILSHTFRNQLYCISAWKSLVANALNFLAVMIYFMVERIWKDFWKVVKIDKLFN